MRHLSRVLLAIAALSLAASASAQQGVSIVEANVKELNAGDTVSVSKIPDGVYLRTVNDPDDIIWERLPEYRVRLNPAPPVHESVELRIKDDDTGQDVYLTFARTSKRFYVRMRWRDATRDTVTKVNRFRDGAAVQFSLGNDETSYVMGDGPEFPVNIWYWRSGSGDVQNLAAGGPGSTTMLDKQPVTGAAKYLNKSNTKANEWTLVMSRDIAIKGKHQVSFERGKVPIAFALWQGAKNQRDGLKNVSDGWILIDFKGK